MRHRATDLAILLIVASTLVMAASPGDARAQTGRLAGLVTDAENGDPIPGVTVVIDGTTRGAITDVDGRYVILNLAPTTYTIRFSFVGYTTRVIDGILVTSGRTTPLDISLGTEVVEAGEVVVEAERPVVDVNQTTSRAIITGDEISRLPVATLQDVISRTSNSYEGFIRGSRRYETKTILDGIDISDAFNPIAPNATGTAFAGAVYSNTNKSSETNPSLFSINPDAVSEVTVNTGANESRYAAASGGVVTVALSEGTGPIRGTASFRYTPSYNRPGPDSLDFYQDTDLYFAERQAKIDAASPSAGLFNYTEGKYPIAEDPEVDARFSVGGSITDNWGFFASGQWFQTNGYQPNEFRKRLNGQLKTTYTLGENTRITALGMAEDNGLWGDWNNRSYLDFWRYYLEGVTQNDGGSYLGSVKITQLIGDKSFLDFQVYNTYKRTRYGYVDDDGDGFTELGEDGDFIDFTDPANIQKYIGTGADHSKMFYENISDGFSDTQLFLPSGSRYKAAQPQPYSEDATQTNLGFKLDYANQVSANHFIQVGSEYKIRRFEYEQIYGVDQSGAKLNGVIEPFIPQQWERKPTELAFYASDRMEYAGLIVNLGVRVELVDRDMEKIADLFYPFQRDTVTVTSSIDPTLTSTLARNNFRREGKVPVDFLFIPSIGVSHPIGTNGAMYFSYARTQQLLPYTTLYQFYDGNHSNNRFFNYQDPEQDPITSNNYEVGVQWEFAEGWGADVNAYMRSIQNYSQTTLTAAHRAPAEGAPILVGSPHTYATSFGYADVRGIELVLRRRPLQLAEDVALGVTASYTFSSVEQALIAGANTRDFIAPDGTVTTLPFDDAVDYKNFPQNVRGGSSTLTGGYDRTHRLVLRSVASLPYELSLGLTGSLESGFLYPREINADPRDRELLTGPTNYQIDLRLEKRFTFQGRYGVDVYVDITNLTDRDNIIAYETATIGTRQVFEEFGRPGPRLITSDGTSLYGPARNVFFGARLRF